MTVYSFLKARDCADILSDPLWVQATHTPCADEALSKRERKAAADSRQAAAEELVSKYASDKLSVEEIRRVIDSIGDNEAYLAFNVRPVERMIDILTSSFDPYSPLDPFSLQLRGGGGIKKAFNSFTSFYGYSSSFMGGGAKLSHDHKTQYKFVLQSLTLWREIMANMPLLWIKADADMVSEPYRLVDTGQGYQRLQSCPRVRNEMSDILSRVQAAVGSWVGLS
ncbi:DUF2009 domain-containing protein, partial [archaeon]